MSREVNALGLVFYFSLAVWKIHPTAFITYWEIFYCSSVKNSCLSYCVSELSKAVLKNGIHKRLRTPSPLLLKVCVPHGVRRGGGLPFTAHFWSKRSREIVCRQQFLLLEMVSFFLFLFLFSNFWGFYNWCSYIWVEERFTWLWQRAVLFSVQNVPTEGTSVHSCSCTHTSMSKKTQNHKK